MTTPPLPGFIGCRAWRAYPREATSRGSRFRSIQPSAMRSISMPTPRTSSRARRGPKGRFTLIGGGIVVLDPNGLTQGQGARFSPKRHAKV